MRQATLAGVVLAGGESRRFGSDKAGAFFDGRTVFDRVLNAVSKVCSPVLVVAPTGRELPATASPHEHVADTHPGEGPLPALLAAFERLRDGTAFVTSCDAPLLTSAAIEALGRNLDAGVGARAVILEGRVQPLMAVYAVECVAPVLREMVAGGERRLTALLGALTIEAFEPAPEDAIRYRSANTREELHTLETLSRKLSGSGRAGPG
jgi:molybdopterin-guanine dinucleotide biosynthesis protein A